LRAVELTVLSYNIWAGGEGRLDRLAQVMAVQQPDVAALVEVTTESAHLLGEALGASVMVAEGHADYHVACLSRLPIRRWENHRLPELAKTLLEVELVWRGEPIRLFVTHLASSHEEHAYPRATELRAILDVLGAAAGDPHLLVGDLNALQPEDPVGTPPPGVVPRGDAAPDALRLVLGPLAECGYTDCYRACHPHEPGFTYPADSPWLRLDYVFAAPPMTGRLTACDVVAGGSAARASDHLAVVARFT
jgi:endonuclease/exonuclease/phosphatase family metal-dependent hydrolase